MFCYRCGANMPDAAAVCPQCGATAQQASPPTATPPVDTPPAYQPAAGAQPAQYGQMPQYGQPQGSSSQATASLILGILSVTCFGLLAGIPAVILGHIAKSNIRKSGGQITGEGKATAGLVMGYISIALLPLVIIFSTAIPNLSRSRMAANEAAAASTIRTINISQITYLTAYPTAGYARDLATLGPGPSGRCAGSGSQEYACLLDGVLGRSNCTPGRWCVKNGYKFSVSAVCNAGSPCDAYVAVAVPVTIDSTGRKSFCSTSDAVIRTSTDASPMILPSVEECQSWSPV